MSDEGSVIQMPVDQLQSNPLQPRGVISPESLVDLVDSIREHGILEPIVVAKTPAGFQIIAGERRWRSARIAGLKTVPVIIKETTPRGMLEMAIVENVQRVDLNPIERARAFQRLIDEFMLSSADIGQRVGKSQSYVSNSLRLLTLPDAIKDGILSGLISEGHARGLAAIGDPKLMIEAYKLVLRESASVRRTEEISRRIKQQEAKETDQRPEVNLVDVNAENLCNDIQRALAVENAPKGGSKVRLHRSRIETRITISLYGGLEETGERLEKIRNVICGS